MPSNRSLALLVASGLVTLAACSKDSANPHPDASADVVDAGPADATPQGPDAAPPAMVDGIAGDTCSVACASLGKTCVTACTDHRSCGGHDGVPPPYAGYACYYWENADHTFTTYDGRSITSCTQPVTLTWDNFGQTEQLGDLLGGNPVSCCCQ